MSERFDVIVIGAGHAGCEAAHAAARLGCHVAICTLTPETVAHMPCNPAIGGTAKGHLVAEIDALGGLMARAIDATGIQFKVLNRSRGPAVWSPRAQADKRRYGQWIFDELRREKNIEWIFGKAGRIVVDHGRVTGLALEDGPQYECASLVMTTGTFLNGLVHIGPEQRPAGRANEPPSRELAESLKSFGFTWGRLKTGIPLASIAAQSISRALSAMARLSSSRATTRRCRFRFSPSRSRSLKHRVTWCTPTIACASWSRQISKNRRCSTDRFTALVHGMSVA